MVHEPTRRLARRAAALCVLALALPHAHADAPEKQLGPDARGKVYTWQAANGLRYEYYVPKDYDPERGANLTLVLHGSNLDRRWGFANHEAGVFRAADVVVCPDGTTSNGNGGFNSLQSQADLERLHELHEELRAALNLRATFLYGHSQGSFFAFLYAGAYPDDVQGVVGQASGVWIGTEMAKRNHHQAIVLMHGTDDPVVSYGQSVGGLEAYRDAKYPLARLRSLDGWNHWPNQPQTEQQLAWCEGMTTGDVERLVACFEVLEGAKEWRDPVALYQVAARLAAEEGAPDKARRAAEKAAAEVDELAADHVAAIGKSLGKSKGKALEDDAWVGHLPLFLRHWSGVPACDAFAKDWDKTLEKQADIATRRSREFWRLSESKPADAFEEGVLLVQEAFLHPYAANEERLALLERWRAEAKDLKLKKSLLKDYDAAIPAWRSAQDKGRKAFEKVSREFR